MKVYPSLLIALVLLGFCAGRAYATWVGSSTINQQRQLIDAIQVLIQQDLAQLHRRVQECLAK